MFSSTHKEHGCCTPKDGGTELAHNAGQKLREVVDSANGSAHYLKAAVAEEVREHPVKSGAIAAGVGFMLGFLLRRR